MITNVIVLTAYCWCAQCCGRTGQPTALGVMPKRYQTLAAPRSIPFGTRVLIKGVGWRTVEDRTRKDIDGWDLFMGPANRHKAAKKFGRRTLTVVY